MDLLYALFLYTLNLHDLTTCAQLILSYAQSNDYVFCPGTGTDNTPGEWQNWESKLGKQWKTAVLDDVKKANDMIKETNVTLSLSGKLKF